MATKTIKHPHTLHVIIERSVRKQGEKAAYLDRKSFSQFVRDALRRHIRYVNKKYDPDQ